MDLQIQNWQLPFLSENCVLKIVMFLCFNPTDYVNGFKNSILFENKKRYSSLEAIVFLPYTLFIRKQLGRMKLQKYSAFPKLRDFAYFSSRKSMRDNFFLLRYTERVNLIQENAYYEMMFRTNFLVV